MHFYSTLFQEYKFHQPTDEECEPEVIHGVAYRESISRRMEGPPYKPHAHNHQDEGKDQAAGHIREPDTIWV